MSTLQFAIPSKGRLKDNTTGFLADCGFSVRQTGGERGYQAALSGGLDVDLQLLSAREIAERLIAGSLHLGVTGQDLLAEIAPADSEATASLAALGFGHARVVVAVPAAWIDVDTMADLDRAAESFRARHGRRMVVATKFQNLTRRFFAGHGLSAYRLIDSAGATEAAPATGVADLIVDITTTGATLKANQLKILSDGEMLASEASLVMSLNADWSQGQASSLQGLLRQVDARLSARGLMRIDTGRRLEDAALDEIRAAFDVRPATAEVDRAFFCQKSDVHAVARLFERRGAGAVAISPVDFLYEGNGFVMSRAEQALAGK
jgi:ATP phosphoribosyltransferase